MKFHRGRHFYSWIVSIGVLSAAGLPGTADANDPVKMQVAGRTSQPIGHYEYCQREEADCRRIALSTAPVRLTHAKWEELLSTNESANRLIRPVTDIEYYGVNEYWTLPDDMTAADNIDLAGDCEDYVLMKRRMLMDKGWPASALLPTVVLQENGEGHAVLTVRTHMGDFILDNLQDEVLTWNQVEYTFLKRVSAAHSGQWEKIVDSRSMVGSINSENASAELRAGQAQ